VDEYIKREDVAVKADEALNILVSIRRGDEMSCGTYSRLFDAIWEIANVPASDAVEVVRCEDCERAKIMADGYLMCRFLARPVMSSDYCSLAARRKNNAID